ncbi:hypothetical protein KKC88_03945 [Patescibacteria group bacterium]|nr:hypothetical protein [Patescibacteria group bacterium]MBU1672966.1 hypothetical protein [Patescibacteria group bacterium]MBU1962999.1 hypothetical protein [Patescibacteria group bacterium]
MVEVVKKDGESNESEIRRFTRKVQGSGKLILAKKNMFVQGKPNKRQQRLSAIRRSKKEEEIDLLKKTGKIVDSRDRFGRQKAPNLKIKIKKSAA